MKLRLNIAFTFFVFTCLLSYGQARQRGIIEFNSIAELKDTPLQPQDSDFAVVVSVSGDLSQLYNYEVVGIADEISSFSLDNFAGRWVEVSNPPFSIGDATDVDITGITDGQILIYDQPSDTFSGSDPPTSGRAGYFETIIWAEENGAVGSNTDEWSYGNGSVGASIGIPSFWDCEAVGMVMNAEVVGVSLGIDLRINSSSVETMTSTQSDAFYDFTTPISVSRGDRINFKTELEVGTWSDVRVGVVLRIEY